MVVTVPFVQEEPLRLFPGSNLTFSYDATSLPPSVLAMVVADHLAFSHLPTPGDHSFSPLESQVPSTKSFPSKALFSSSLLSEWLVSALAYLCPKYLSEGLKCSKHAPPA